MSVIGDRVWAINTQLNLISRDQELFDVADDELVSLQEQGVLVARALESPRVTELVRIVKALSTPSISDPQLPTWRIEQLLNQSELAVGYDYDAVTAVEKGIKGVKGVQGAEGDESDEDDEGEAVEQGNPYETEIEWILVAKAAMQLYGALLQNLIDQNISLDDHLWYWDGVSQSYRMAFLLWLQKWPLRLWGFTRDVYSESARRIQSVYASAEDVLTSTDREEDQELSGQVVPTTGEAQERGARTVSVPLSHRWKHFYQVVRDTVQDRSLVNIQDRLLSPIALCQVEARDKAFQVRRLRENIACGIGALVHEGLNFGRGEWKDVLERSVSLMETIMVQTATINGTVADFEENIFRFVDNDPELAGHVHGDPSIAPHRLARRLLTILQHRMPRQEADIRAAKKGYGKPSLWIRYWLPAAVCLLSSSMVLRVLTSRRADIVQWVTDLGLTARDFWSNWVVDPLRKIVRTIRHDENREIALMSRDSLRADLESLERMVVDFAVDKPHFATPDGTAVALSPSQVADIRSGVARGDVTPVLRAYEKDLKTPLAGAIKGDLVRSLLIQVQKSKVDMEVALAGIDSLLKSQELVFGFVGLTPGILVSVGVCQYVRGVMSGRMGLRQRNRASRTIRCVRSISRMLARADLTPEKTMTYEQIGNLLCQVHILRGTVPGTMPENTRKSFLVDLDEVVNLRMVPFQKKMMEDIVAAYGKWLL